MESSIVWIVSVGVVNIRFLKCLYVLEVCFFIVKEIFWKMILFWFLV